MERYRTTILLGVVLLVLAALAFFLSSNNASSPGEATPTPNIYIWQDDNPAIALDVMSGTSKVSIVKDVISGTWQIKEPVDRPADLFQVGGVANSLQILQAQYTLSDTTDLTQYGLDGQPMSVTVTFSDTAHTTRTLLIGHATPDGGGYYVKLPDGNKLYTVINSTIEPMRTWLVSPPVELPSPTPVPITPVTATPTDTTTPTPTAEGTSSEPPSTATPAESTSPSAPTATQAPVPEASATP